MARSRIRERDRRRTQERVTASQGTGRAKESVDQVIESLPAGSQPEIKKALREYERARDREVDTLRGELQLYRTLATVGTTSATFAHESTKPLHNIARMAKTIRTRGQALLRDAYEANLHKPVDIIVKSVSALQAFAKVTLNLLGFEKRRPGRVDVHRTLRSVLELFQPFFARRDVEAITQFGDCQPFILGSDAALESVLTNLLTNSLRAFERGGTAKRVIICRTDVIDDTVRLSVLDSGPGINGLKVDEIWLPGESTTIGGTGLGLTIVRDTVGDLGGSVSAVARGELGGAEIIIELPTLRGT
jgi:C4-dicarboxylate-specific signal transduction histidine kinase